MSLDLLDPATLSPGQRGRWQDLADDAVDPNPFHEPALLEPAARHLRPRAMRLLVVERAGAWVACLPVQTGPGGVGALIAWRHPYSFLSTPLLRRTAPVDAARALLEPLRARRAALASLPFVAAGPAERALRTAIAELGLAVAWERRHHRPALQRRPGEVVALLSSKRRSELRRNGRRLEEQLGAPLTVRERSGDPDALQRFLALEAAGWKGERGTALASSDDGRRFFVEMATAFAAAGRLQLRSLEVGDQVVAMSCELIGGDALYGFKSAFDERFRARAPGAWLLHDTAMAFQRDERLRLFDSCSDGGNAFVDHLLPERRELVSLIAGPRWSRPLVARAVDAARRARALRGRPR